MGHLYDDYIHFNMINISCMVWWLLHILHLSMYPFGPFYPLLPGSQCLDKRVPFSGPLPLPWDTLSYTLRYFCHKKFFRMQNYWLISKVIVNNIEIAQIIKSKFWRKICNQLIYLNSLNIQILWQIQREKDRLESL